MIKVAIAGKEQNMRLFTKISAVVLTALMFFSGSSFANSVSYISTDFENCEINEAPTNIFDCRQQGSGTTLVKEENGNKYLSLHTAYYTGEDSNQSFVQYYKANQTIDGNLYLTMDIMSETNDGQIQCSVTTSADVTYYPLNLYNDGTMKVLGLDAGKYETGKWYTLRVYLNMANTDTKKIDAVAYFSEKGKSETKYQTTFAAGNAKQKNIRISNPGWAVKKEEGKKNVFNIDNFALIGDGAMEVASSSPEKGGSIISPSSDINVKFTNEAESVKFLLGDTEISKDEIEKVSATEYKISPKNPLVWGEEYTLGGEAYDNYGQKCEIDIPFSVSEEPDNFIELLGFYDKDGRKISNLISGNVTSKIRLWQKEKGVYTVICGVYKNVDGKIKMLSASCDVIDTSDKMKDISLSGSIPENTENCFMRVFIWDSFKKRVPYKEDIIYGKTELKEAAK